MPSTLTTMATRSFLSAKAAPGNCVSAVVVAIPAAKPFVICLRLKSMFVLPGSFFCAASTRKSIPQRQHLPRRSDKSPPHLRHEPEASRPALDMADGGEVEMGAGDADPVRRSHVQSA